MEYITLGKSGLKVSRIGLGSWQASDDWKGTDEDVIRALGKGYELGINLVDTAEAYGSGRSESVVGRAVKQIGRNNLVIATKVYGPHLRYDELQRACKASMARLGVNEIDVYQVHWPDPWEQIPLKYTMKALEKLYTEGKIRAIAVSNFAVRDLEEARSYLSKTDIASNQLRYNLLERNIEEEVIPYCRKNKIHILAWSPIAQGALTGKYNIKNVPKGDMRDINILFAPSNLTQIEGLLGTLSRIASRHGKTVTQVALNWLLKDQLVVPIAGVKTEVQAERECGGRRLETGR